MSIALIIVAALLGLAATGSGVAKLTKQASVLETLAHVGVKTEHIPVLGALELAGALGLVVGIWVKPLGIAAAIGLALYFLGAVAAHARKKDKPADFAPAFVLFALAVVTVVLELKR